MAAGKRQTVALNRGESPSLTANITHIRQWGRQGLGVAEMVPEVKNIDATKALIFGASDMSVGVFGVP